MQNNDNARDEKVFQNETIFLLILEKRNYMFLRERRGKAVSKRLDEIDRYRTAREDTGAQATEKHTSNT